ncbi:MAG: hypothetical protein M0Z70_01110, partial [Nitrospiraceae bacterium]|nr:hypothetical protein [Nitrospiraceae bacterium]
MKIAAILSFITVPPLINDITVRIITLCAVYAVVFTVIHKLVKKHIKGLDIKHTEAEKQHLSEIETMFEPMIAFLYNRAQLIPVLTNQLSEVTRHKPLPIVKTEKWVVFGGLACKHLHHQGYYYCRRSKLHAASGIQ